MKEDHKDICVFVDPQNDFITGPLGSEEAVKALEVMLLVARCLPMRGVVVTRDTHLQYTPADTIEKQRLPHPHCRFETAGWAIDTDLQVALEQRYARDSALKFYNKVDRFTSGGIHTLVEAMHVTDGRVYICGLCTDICVISTALMLRSKMPSTRIICIRDACAGLTPDKHAHALDVMSSCMIDAWDFSMVAAEFGIAGDACEVANG